MSQPATMNSVANDDDGRYIWRLDPGPRLRRVAGVRDGSLSSHGGSALAKAVGVDAIAANGRGRLVAAGEGRIQRADTQGVVRTVARTGRFKFQFARRAPTWDNAQVSSVVADGRSSVYWAELQLHRVRRIDEAGVVTTVAGTGTSGYSGDGGPGRHAMLSWPGQIALDSDGGLLIADSRNHRVRRVGRDGIITTVAGTGHAGYAGDAGPAAKAMLLGPQGVAVDSTGRCYIADTGNCRIRRVDRSGVISTVAGTGVRAYAGDSGDARRASFTGPWQVLAGPAGELYVLDAGYTERVRMIDARGRIATLLFSQDRILVW